MGPSTTRPCKLKVCSLGGNFCRLSFSFFHPFMFFPLQKGWRHEEMAKVVKKRNVHLVTLALARQWNVSLYEPLNEVPTSGNSKQRDWWKAAQGSSSNPSLCSWPFCSVLSNMAQMADLFYPNIRWEYSPKIHPFWYNRSNEADICQKRSIYQYWFIWIGRRIFFYIHKHHDTSHSEALKF